MKAIRQKTLGELNSQCIAILTLHENANVP